MDRDDKPKRKLHRIPWYPAAYVERLREEFPLAFCVPPKPLEIGVHKKIAERLGASVLLPRAMKWWTSRFSYLAATAGGGHRIDLHGNPVSEISSEHREIARAKLRNMAKPYGRRAS